MLNSVYDDFDITDDTLKKYNGHDKEVVIPEGIRYIECGAFRENIDVVNVHIPVSVVDIGDMAFSRCVNLASISVSNSVTTIGEYAFAYCSSLESIRLSENITVLSKGLFGGCKKLHSILMSDKVTTFQESSFLECERLISFDFPKHLQIIESTVFYGCHSLTKICIPNSVVTLKSDAFQNCSNLTEIIVPNSLINRWLNHECLFPKMCISFYYGVVYCDDGSIFSDNRIRKSKNKISNLVSHEFFVKLSNGNTGVVFFDIEGINYTPKNNLNIIRIPYRSIEEVEYLKGALLSKKGIIVTLEDGKRYNFEMANPKEVFEFLHWKVLTRSLYRLN